MLAHTTSRHIIIASQFAIGLVLLSASYFSGDDNNHTVQVRADQSSSELTIAATEETEQC